MDVLGKTDPPLVQGGCRTQSSPVRPHFTDSTSTATTTKEPDLEGADERASVLLVLAVSPEVPPYSGS